MADAGPMARFRALIEDATLMDQVVQRIAEDGETLKSLAKNWKVPYGSLAQWVIEDRERSEQYSRALRFVADSAVHEMLPIADNKEGSGALQDTAARKLQIETRRWLAGKWDRHRYGDSTEINHTGSVSLVSILAGLPRTGREPVTLEGKDVQVLGKVEQVTPAEKIPALPEKVEEARTI